MVGDPPKLWSIAFGLGQVLRCLFGHLATIPIFNALIPVPDQGLQGLDETRNVKKEILLLSPKTIKRLRECLVA